MPDGAKSSGASWEGGGLQEATAFGHLGKGGRRSDIGFTQSVTLSTPHTLGGHEMALVE